MLKYLFRYFRVSLNILLCDHYITETCYIEKQSQQCENEIVIDNVKNFLTERVFSVCIETQTHNVKVDKLLNI